MKSIINIFFIIITASIFACNNIKSEQSIIKSNDSIQILKKEIVVKDSIIKLYSDSLFKAIHNIQDFDRRFKLAKIQRYIDITKNKPSNQKFFYGWIVRTMIPDTIKIQK